MLILAFARSLKLQRADADQFSCTRNQSGAAPVGVGRIGENRLVQHVFPVAGKLLSGRDATGERTLAATGATDNHAFTDLCRLRRADLECRQINFAERLHQSETGLLVEPERMALHHATVAKM